MSRARRKSIAGGGLQAKTMNPLFFILSVLYIFGIFFWADSPTVSRISVLNPFSLLHIPLYGFLTFFLVRALAGGRKSNSRFRYALTAFIAIGTAILDELNQSYIPHREGSITDVLLDVIGISLALFLSYRARLPLRPSFPNKVRKAGIHHTT
jgi:VanZ family protein